MLNNDGKVEKSNPRLCIANVFVELLKVDRKIASDIEDYYRGSGEFESLESIDGFTDEVRERFDRFFEDIQPIKTPSRSIAGPRAQPEKPEPWDL